MILFSRLLVSRFLLPAVSSPQTENTRSTYSCRPMPQMQELSQLTAGPGQVSQVDIWIVTQNLSPLFCE